MSSRVITAFEANNNRQAALWTYRHLLRACHIAFKGDHETRRAARAHAASSFRANRALKTGSIEAAQGIEHAQGVAQILRENVVQGKRVGDVGEKYKLNIHEHTQRLDNETATTLKGTRKSFREIKESQF